MLISDKRRKERDVNAYKLYKNKVILLFCLPFDVLCFLPATAIVRDLPGYVRHLLYLAGYPGVGEFLYAAVYRFDLQLFCKIF